MVTNSAAQTEPASEDTHRRMGAPTFLETESGSFKTIERCSKGEIAAEIMALVEQAAATVHEADRPATAESTTRARSLLYEAQALSDYLNV